MITKDQLTLSGKDCTHFKEVFGSDGVHMHTASTWSNQKCALCHITVDQSLEQESFRWYLWRQVIKKLNLKWEEFDFNKEKVNVAFVYDFEYVKTVNVNHETTYKKIGEKQITKYKKLVVTDQKTSELNGFAVYGTSTEYKVAGLSPEARELCIISTRAPLDGPSRIEFFEVMKWAAEKDKELENYILNIAQKEFAIVRTKNISTRDKTKQKNDFSKADKFSYKEQTAIGDILINLKVNEALALVGGKVSQYAKYSYGHSYQINLSWEGPKKYLTQIYLDKEILDLSGQKLYDAIVDLLGKEKADEYINSSDEPTLKRLGVCILGNVTLGLIEENSRVRLAAEKLIKKNATEAS